MDRDGKFWETLHLVNRRTRPYLLGHLRNNIQPNIWSSTPEIAILLINMIEQKPNKNPCNGKDELNVR